MASKTSLSATCFLLALLASSCAESVVSTALSPVEGEAFAKSQPAAGARIVLHPASADTSSWPNGYPRAIVGDDGKFKISTSTPGDGAPPGEYVVLVEWPAAADPSASEVPADRLAGRYNNPTSSKIRVKVENQPLILPRIDLQ